MDLCIAAVSLRHPQFDERLEVDYELAESVSEASSAITRRLEQGGWVVNRIATKKLVDLLTTQQAAEYVGVTWLTFQQICKHYHIEPAHILSDGTKLWKKWDLEAYRTTSAV